MYGAAIYTTVVTTIAAMVVPYIHVASSVRFVGGRGFGEGGGGWGRFNLPPLVDDDHSTGDCKVWSGGRI